jgi:endonuclease-3
MATAINKQKVIDKVFSTLGKQARGDGAEARPVLEQFLYAIGREGTTRETADQVYRTLQERFYDWNEVRVSSVHEVAEAMADLVADSEPRAQRVIDFLQEVFENEFAFDLEVLHKKGLKQAAKQLANYQAANDYAVSWVVQHSLGGHAIPLDEAALRVLRRLGILEEAGSLETLRASMEHQVPKARGSVFVDLISELAEEYCTPDEPLCAACPLSSACCAAASFVKATPVSTASKKPR